MQPDAPADAVTALDLLRAGRPYRASDPHLQHLRRRARRLARTFNATPEDDHLGRLGLLASLFGEIGADPEVDAPLHVEYGMHVTLGDHVVIGPGCVLVDAGRITIGHRVRLGAGVHLCAVARPHDPRLRAEGFEQAAPIVVGDDVWIGNGTLVNPGVAIGAGSTIGPGSVVLESVPPGVYATGNPCRVVRSLAGGDGARGATPSGP